MKWGGLPYGGAQAEGLVEQRLTSSVHLSDDIEVLVQSRKGRIPPSLHRLLFQCSVEVASYQHLAFPLSRVQWRSLHHQGESKGQETSEKG